MTLERYLKRHDLTASAFAKHAGVATSTITRILRGEMSPTLGLAKRIETATGGKVRIREMVGE